MGLKVPFHLTGLFRNYARSRRPFHQNEQPQFFNIYRAGVVVTTPVIIDDSLLHQNAKESKLRLLGDLRDIIWIYFDHTQLGVPLNPGIE